MSHALVFDGVSKRYGRGQLALDGMSFHVPRGAIAGFIGPNGAGKTTTYSVISGFLRPDAGTVNILDEGEFSAAKFKGRVGVLPQDAELPDRHTPRELLEHLGRLQGMSRVDATTEADRLLTLVRLDAKRTAAVGTLSHGMRRRVAVATALCGSPELVLLDEPLSGLDPAEAYALRDRLEELRGKQTLVISSHNLDDVERLCDWIIIVRAGRCVRQGPTAELTGATELTCWTLDAPPPLDALRAALPSVTLHADGLTLTARAAADDLDRASLTIMRTLCDHGVAVRGLTRGMGLERQYLAAQG